MSVDHVQSWCGEESRPVSREATGVPTQETSLRARPRRAG